MNHLRSVLSAKTGPKSKEKKVTHRDVCTAVAKISAFLRCGNRDAASEWSYKLVGYLVTLELLPPRNVHDDSGQIPTTSTRTTSDGTAD
jgi:hypothetical protein